jgi:drug/metabolite transporter (DMT)-like permease
VVRVADGSLIDAEQASSHAIVVRATSSDGSSSVSAFTIQVAAYVRTLGLIELVFTFLMGRFVFGERASRYEMLGVAALVAGIVLVLHSH